MGPSMAQSGNPGSELARVNIPAKVTRAKAALAATVG